MIAALALLLVGAAPPGVTLGDAHQALAAGRIEQARLIVDNALANGATGRDVDALLADIAFATGNNADAAARYARLAAADPANALFAERSAIAALRSGDTRNAGRLIISAYRFPRADSVQSGS